MSAAARRSYIDESKIVEAGWQALRERWLPADCPAVQASLLRAAFFAGAQHMFSSFAEMFDGDDVDSDGGGNAARVRRIDAELHAFIEDFTASQVPTEGGA